MKTRAFIAINLPPKTKKQVQELTEEIKTQINGEVRWVEPQNFHFTLHFLGYLNDIQIKKTQEFLNRWTKDLPRTNIKISGFGVFPNIHAPKVFFLRGKERQNTLSNWQKYFSQKLDRIGIKTDQREWQPHLTFGRAEGKIVLPKNLIGKYGGKITFIVESIDLMKSELKRAGPIYTILQKYTL